MGAQRYSSRISALMYGSAGRSASAGRREPPRTWSSSAWARCWMAGKSAIARRKPSVEDVRGSIPPVRSGELGL